MLLVWSLTPPQLAQGYILLYPSLQRASKLGSFTTLTEKYQHVGKKKSAKKNTCLLNHSQSKVTKLKIYRVLKENSCAKRMVLMNNCPSASQQSARPVQQNEDFSRDNEAGEVFSQLLRKIVLRMTRKSLFIQYRQKITIAQYQEQVIQQKSSKKRSNLRSSKQS